VAVTWSYAGQRAEQQFSFTTAGFVNDLSVYASHRGAWWTFSLRSQAPHPSTIELRGPAGQTLTMPFKKRVVRTNKLTPGRWQACAQSGGPSTGYEPLRVCRSFTVAKPPASRKRTHRS
jgi:hypothetical protein